jgi:hypothetical protein
VYLHFVPALLREINNPLQIYIINKRLLTQAQFEFFISAYDKLSTDGKKEPSSRGVGSLRRIETRNREGAGRDERGTPQGDSGKGAGYQTRER